MALAAAQVVDLLAARLSAVPAFAGRVFTSRAWPIDETELPAWRVLAQDELAERQYVGQPVNEHVLSVEFQGMCRQVNDLDDAMHALAATGMTAIFAEPVPHDLQLTSIARSMERDGQAAIGLITVTATARFAVDQSAPEIIL